MSKITVNYVRASPAPHCFRFMASPPLAPFPRYHSCDS